MLLALVYVAALPFRTVVEARVQRDIEDKVRDPLGRYLGEVVKPGETITSESSGYVGYYTNATLYDFPGLESPRVVSALQKASDGGLPVHSLLSIAAAPSFGLAGLAARGRLRRRRARLRSPRLDTPRSGDSAFPVVRRRSPSTASTSTTSTATSSSIAASPSEAANTGNGSAGPTKTPSPSRPARRTRQTASSAGPGLAPGLHTRQPDARRVHRGRTDRSHRLLGDHRPQARRRPDHDQVRQEPRRRVRARPQPRRGSRAGIHLRPVGPCPLPGELIYHGGGFLFIRLASLAAFVVAAVYAYRIAAELGVGRWPTALVLAYLALDQNQVFFGMAGMETQIAVGRAPRERLLRAGRGLPEERRHPRPRIARPPRLRSLGRPRLPVPDHSELARFASRGGALRGGRGAMADLHDDLLRLAHSQHDPREEPLVRSGLPGRSHTPAPGSISSGTSSAPTARVAALRPLLRSAVHRPLSDSLRGRSRG